MFGALLNFFRGLALVAVFTICGGQWMTLQTVAWGRMLVEYAQQSTIADALAETFDGAHPCSLCCQIKKGQSQEKQSAAQLNFTKLVMIRPDATPSLSRPTASTSLVLKDMAALARNEQPPVPPPRTMPG